MPANEPIYWRSDTTERMSAAVGVACTKRTIVKRLGDRLPPNTSSNQTGTCGPTLRDMFALTRRHMPPIDILHLLDMVIFNVLACNTDAHAKNYSIMI